MIKKRIKLLRGRMAKIGLDGFLIMDPKNRRYMTGFTGTAGTVLITQKQSLLFTDFRYLNQAISEAPNFEIVQYQHSCWAKIQKVVSRLGLEQLGFEGEYISYNQYQEMAAIFKQNDLKAQQGLVEELRMIKDYSEIEYIKKAAEIADYAFQKILEKIKPGVTEREIAVELEYLMASQGASGPSFATIVASGHRSSLPHGVASGKKIANGELVTMDFGCIYQGYCSDMTRTVVIGQPTFKQTEIYEIVLEAQKLGLSKIRAGLSANQIDQISRNYIDDQGYGDYFGHGLGHSLGLNVHENPRLSPKDKTLLVENMVVTLEPGIYIPDWGGVRIEDLVVVLDNGYENLTKSSKELIAL